MPTTNYIWDHLNDSYLMETDGSGATTAVYTQEPAHYGGLISQDRGTGTSYFHQDNLGSTRSLTNEAELVTDTFAYDAWGEDIDRSGITQAPFRWVGSKGYYFDTDIDAYYVRARAYRPASGVWFSLDPLQIDLLTVVRALISLYSYVDNNPTRTFDPSGLAGEIPGNFTDIVYPCSHWSVKDWGEDLCNFSNYSSSGTANQKPNKCQHCKCQDLKDANTPMTDTEIQEIISRAQASLGASAGQQCDVRTVIQEKCAGEFAVTCINPTADLGPHIICIPKSLSRCDMAGLIMHEFVHALQACQGRQQGKPRRNGLKGEISCEEVEAEAYGVNCSLEVKHKCIRPDEQAAAIKRCVGKGKAKSCDQNNKGAFSNLCDELRAKSL